MAQTITPPPINLQMTELYPLKVVVFISVNIISLVDSGNLEYLLCIKERYHSFVRYRYK